MCLVFSVIAQGRNSSNFLRDFGRTAKPQLNYGWHKTTKEAAREAIRSTFYGGLEASATDKYEPEEAGMTSRKRPTNLGAFWQPGGRLRPAIEGRCGSRAKPKVPDKMIVRREKKGDSMTAGVCQSWLSKSATGSFFGRGEAIDSGLSKSQP